MTIALSASGSSAATKPQKNVCVPCKILRRLAAMNALVVVAALLVAFAVRLLSHIVYANANPGLSLMITIWLGVAALIATNIWLIRWAKGQKANSRLRLLMLIYTTAIPIVFYLFDDSVVAFVLI